MCVSRDCVCHVIVCASCRLEARVAASRRILALAKRRDDVGHRLKLFESGDEERRSSGAGVQLQVRAAIFTGFFRIESRANTRPLNPSRASAVGCRKSGCAERCRGNCPASPTSCGRCWSRCVGRAAWASHTRDARSIRWPNLIHISRCIAVGGKRGVELHTQRCFAFA